MKSDDDMFINVPNLIHILLGGTVAVYKSTVFFYDKYSVDARNGRNRLKDTKDLLLGFKHCSARPVTDVKNKWYTPNYMFSGEYYPEYFSGSAYLMTQNSAQRLYDESLITPLFHLEDVFLTGIVAERIKLKRRHHPLFRYFPDSDICTLRGRLAQHLVSPTDMRIFYSFVTNLNNSCEVPEKNFTKVKFNLVQLRHSLNCASSG